MQHMGLQRESESGEVEARFRVDGIDTRIVDRAPPESRFLRFLDPYGDTVFNQLQLPELIAELQDFAAKAAEKDLRENVDLVITFLRESVEVHTYVRFVGD